VPNVWTQLVAQVVVPAGANYLRIDISGQNASGGSTLLIDDVTMWRLNVQPAETNPLLATMLDPPRSLLYASTNVAVTANTWSLVGSAMAGLYAKGGMELSNSRTTVPKDGLYAIYAQVIFAVATVAPTLAGLMIRKNANGGAASGTLLLNTFSSQYQSALRRGGITGYVEAELVAGDYVEFFVYQAAASGSWTWNGGSSFTYLTARWVAPL
jgi:hypothetical protein